MENRRASVAICERSASKKMPTSSQSLIWEFDMTAWRALNLSFSYISRLQNLKRQPF